MPGHRQELLETPQEVAADDLDVIEIELDAHIRAVDPGDQVRRLLDPSDEIVRPVARIERLDQQHDILLRREVGGACEIGHEHPLGRRALLGRHHPGHGVDRRAVDRDDVVERLLEDLCELAFAPGHGAQPAFPAILPRLRVDAELHEAVALELGTDRRRRDLVGKLQLDGLEAGRLGGAETLDQRPLGEHVGEIGGKPGH